MRISKKVKTLHLILLLLKRHLVVVFKRDITKKLGNFKDGQSINRQSSSKLLKFMVKTSPKYRKRLAWTGKVLRNFTKNGLNKMDFQFIKRHRGGHLKNKKSSSKQSRHLGEILRNWRNLLRRGKKAQLGF